MQITKNSNRRDRDLLLQGGKPRSGWKRALAGATAAGLVLAILSYRRMSPDRASGIDPDDDRSAPLPVLSKQSAQRRATGAVRFSLLYVLPPIWLASSLADWACHRYSRIEHTAGVKEATIHLMLLGEMGLPVLAAVFCEITSPIIVLMIGAYLAHEATVYVDLRIAVSKRDVTPIEQMVHSVMEMMPLFGIWLVSVLREDELRALLGIAGRPPDATVRLKEKPLPLSYRIGLVTAIVLFGGGRGLRDPAAGDCRP